MQTRKRFGQHFLSDNVVIEQCMQLFAPQPTDHVIEIGPGRGALTQYLIPPHVKQLDLIELDRDLVDFLQKKYQQNVAIQIISADVLTVDFAKLVKENQPIRIIGNLPYNISTPLFFHLFQFLEVIHDMQFMVQFEVAKRLAANPGTHDYGRLSVMAQYFCEINLLFDVSPEAFTPPPQVTSAVISLRPQINREHKVKDSKRFEKMVHDAFAMRRKTLKNNLKILSAEDWSVLNIDSNLRAEMLSVDDFVRITNYCEGSKSCVI